MKKLILSIALVLMCAGARGEGDTLKYRVCLFVKNMWMRFAGWERTS